MARELTYGSLHQIIIDSVLNNIDKNNKILDIGCGYGAFLEKLDKLNYNNLYGVDGYLEPEFKNFEFTKGFLDKKLTFESNSFDNIFCIEVIEHVENPYGLIKEMLRVLNKGGKLYITSPNIYTLVSKLSFVLTGRLAYFTDNDAKFTIIPGHISPFVINIVKEYFKDEMVLNKTFYSEFVLPLTGGKIKLPFKNRFFGNIVIYEFIKK